MLTEDQIRAALREVIDPELQQNIVDLNMVRNISVHNGNVSVDLALTVAGCPMQNQIQESVVNKLKGLAGINEVKVHMGAMSDQERKALLQRLHGPKKAPIMEADSKTRIIIVTSGKGGVGKSTVTVNLAVALASLGKQVGILDADIYGFSIPRMIGASGQPTPLDDDTLLPVEAKGVKVISMGNMVNEDTPVIWRGPMLSQALEQFLTDVLWGDLDYLLIDSPPGTGDIALSTMQMLPKARVLIVTTPQPSAFKVASRVGYMAQKIQLPILGIIENMSYFTCDQCGKQHNIFGEGGAEEVAKNLGVSVLGKIPLTVETRELGDKGEPIALQSQKSPAGKAFFEVARVLNKEW